MYKSADVKGVCNEFLKKVSNPRQGVKGQNPEQFDCHDPREPLVYFVFEKCLWDDSS